MHMDGELFRLLFTVGIMLAIGVPMITRTVWLPTSLKCENVSQDSIAPRQQSFFDTYDKKLAEVGFFPFSTFRVSNLMGTNLNRAYMNPSDPARILLTLLSIKDSFTISLEIVTRFTDGMRLSTKNTQLSSVLAVMPNRIVQQFPGIDDPLELKRRHDQKSEALQPRIPEYRAQSSYFSDLNDYHSQYCQYQVSKNLLRFDTVAGIYRATYLTGLRGVANFLNPIADNFTLYRFLLGVLFGAVPPLLVATQHAQITAWLATVAPGSLFLSAASLTPIACTLSGIAVGCIFRNKNFIWAIVLGYLPAKLLGIPSAVSLGYGIYMAVVADITSRFITARRKLV
jgi:hypothetical protein